MSPGPIFHHIVKNWTQNEPAKRLILIRSKNEPRFFKWHIVAAMFVEVCQRSCPNISNRCLKLGNRSWSKASVVNLYNFPLGPLQYTLGLDHILFLKWCKIENFNKYPLNQLSCDR